MSDLLDQMGAELTHAEDKSLDAVGKLFETARAEAVWSPPIEVGEHVVITASEVLATGGVGFGGGLGEGPSRRRARRSWPPPEPIEPGGGAGLGGGGGGFTLARPVAAVTIGPDGVRIRPILDPTKLALALLTTVGTMAVMFLRLSRPRRR